MRQREKQPWNPFPLACLKVEGLSACAKAVLIYLGVRSNYKGETCVGYRTIQRELVRSKDFVTAGLKELRNKGYLEESQRDRHKHQADWKTLNASLILKSRTESSPDSEEIGPEEQDQTQMSSPEFGRSSPAQQGKTSQIDSNLADYVQENLPDQNKEELVSRASEIGAAPLLTLALEKEDHPFMDETEARMPAQPNQEETQNQFRMAYYDYAKKEPLMAMKDEHRGLLLQMFAHHFKVDGYKNAQISRIMDSHLDFMWNEYNIENVRKLLERRDWKKSITNIDDFAFRWSSMSEKGFYGQAKRVCVDFFSCSDKRNGQDCGDPAYVKRMGMWMCAQCIERREIEALRRELEAEKEREERRRTIVCYNCKRKLIIPMGWDAAKFTGKNGTARVSCIGCKAIYEVPDWILKVACPDYKPASGSVIEEGAVV